MSTIVDLRTYSFDPGKMKAFLALFERDGLPLYRQYCGTLIGYFTSARDDVEQLFHLWAYASAEDRDERRARLYADARWQTFLESALPLIRDQESRLVEPAGFSPPISLPKAASTEPPSPGETAAQT